MICVRSISPDVHPTLRSTFTVALETAVPPECCRPSWVEDEDSQLRYIYPGMIQTDVKSSKNNTLHVGASEGMVCCVVYGFMVNTFEALNQEDFFGFV